MAEPTSQLESVLLPDRVRDFYRTDYLRWIDEAAAKWRAMAEGARTFNDLLEMADFLEAYANRLRDSAAAWQPVDPG